MRYLIPIMLLGLFACSQQYYNDRDFPVLLTIEPEDLDSTGVTFRAKLVFNDLYHTDSYGFLWDLHEPNILISNKIEVGTVLNEHSFQARIDTLFSKGFIYNVRAYALIEGKTVYGNTVSVESMGCKNCYWEKVLSNAKIYGTGRPVGISGDKKGNVVFCSGQTYSFDPEINIFERISDFPIESSRWWQPSHERFFPTRFYERPLILETNTGHVYEIKDDDWHEISYPLHWNPHRTSIAFSNEKVFTILYDSHSPGARRYFSYLVDEDKWRYGTHDLQNMLGACTYDENTFILLKNRSILTYTLNDNSWNEFTQYPGKCFTDVVCFSHLDKVYFGFSYNIDIRTEKEGNWIEELIWSYDLNSGQWNRVPDFPDEFLPSFFFYFIVDNNLYIGVRRYTYYQTRDHGYDLYKLNLDRLP